jgi:glycosyltransferase involved in cell wall biosynthesis
LVLNELELFLDDPLPLVLPVMEGNYLLLRGWAFSPQFPTHRLEVQVGKIVHLVDRHSMGRPDVFKQVFPVKDPAGHSLFSGFWAMVPFSRQEYAYSVPVTFIATAEDGRTAKRTVGAIWITPTVRKPLGPEWLEDGPRVAICMATYNPPVALFRRQVESLKSQTHSNWICIVTDDQSSDEIWREMLTTVGDDPRFHLFRNAERLNFYRNFEEAMLRVPFDAHFVALCDQDDRWDSDKLETLLNAFEPDTQLAYSDCRLTDAEGKVYFHTFWHNRRNNYTNLQALLVANTVTGAASLFRAALLDKVLPLPPRIGDAYHDHWLAVVAMANGNIVYVDRPLYDYVQHDANVIGHNYRSAPGFLRYGFEVIRRLHNPRQAFRAARTVANQGQIKFEYVLRTVLFAKCILLRHSDIKPKRRRIFEKFARFDASLLTPFSEKVKATIERRPTLNLEGYLLYCAAATHGVTRYHRFRNRRFGPPKMSLDSPPEIPKAEYIRDIFHSASRLTPALKETEPRRVNILMARIEFRYVYGGYLGMFQLALRLVREGYKVRIILLEQHEFAPDKWREEIKRYPGVETLFEDVEVIYRHDRSQPVECNPNDQFVATNGWGAHVAHSTLKVLGRERFLFLAQDYEPFFMPASTIQALFRQAYDLPQFTLFSTELLRDFFQEQRLGVFAQRGGKANSAVFSNAILSFSPTALDMQRETKRLVFYARPEEHAARNLFEIGMAALMQVAARPESENWTFHGIGSLGGATSLPLGNGREIEMLPKTSLEEYRKMLPRHDVGVSLMLTPHPSLVPLEMAAAGMWAVTNTFMNKTAERLRDISTNILAAEPTIEGVRDMVLEAMSRADDVEARLAGSKVNWPTSWDEAFQPEEIRKVLAFLS